MEACQGKPRHLLLKLGRIKRASRGDFYTSLESASGSYRFHYGDL